MSKTKCITDKELLDLHGIAKVNIDVRAENVYKK